MGRYCYRVSPRPLNFLCGDIPCLQEAEERAATSERRAGLVEARCGKVEAVLREAQAQVKTLQKQLVASQQVGMAAWFEIWFEI